MKYIKTYEYNLKEVEIGDYVIVISNCDIRRYGKDFLMSNVGQIIDCSTSLTKVRYNINPNNPEQGYILNENNETIIDKCYLRHATIEEIELQKIKDDAYKYNL